MSNAVTLAFPPWLTKFDATAITFGVRGQNILVPVNGVVTVDPSTLNLDELLASGFTIAPTVTTTAGRPTVNTYPGQMVFDSTLGTPIFRNAANTGWVSASGSAV